MSEVSKTDILIVDDRDEGLTALEAVLSCEQYNLVKANSGYEALDLLRDHDFAVILLDVQMPGIDGFETATRIRQTESTRLTPIIFVTAINKDDVYVNKGYQHGAIDYVFKPFDATILRSKVGLFVELHKKTKLLEAAAEQIKESERRERYLRLAQLEVESLKRYRNLADSIPHIVWRAKADGTMDYFNKVWTDVTGFTNEQSVGLGWQSAFDPDDLKQLLRTWMKAMATGADFQIECRLKCFSGEWRWHWIRGVPERRNSGDIMAWLGTCTDVHERKCAEEELVDARREADAANRAKTHFLANMSHEIRTPLNSILGFAELLTNSPEFQDESLDSLLTIQRNGKSLLKIIDEILDISKVEADRLETEEVDVDLKVLFGEIQNLLGVQAAEKKLKFETKCEGLIPKSILTDPTRLRQILINMVGNAIKFTAKGHVTIGLSWKPNGKKGQLRCSITDSGVGLDPDSVQRLFQPFMQADSSTTRKFGGTGLGLALSKKLANALGGDVRLESSSKDQGSCFAVEIQAAYDPDCEMWDRFEVQPRSVAPQISVGGSLEGVEVLVVDDAGDNRTLMSRFLSAAGASVDCATNGYEGIDRAMSKHYDVVLMDIQMPQLDGYSATSFLREKGYDGPIIALTAHALKEERENSIRAGCDDHLTKPIDRSTLIDRVVQFVEARSISAI